MYNYSNVNKEIAKLMMLKLYVFFNSIGALLTLDVKTVGEMQ